HVQAVRPFERPTRLHLLDHRSGEDVPRPELHLAGQVALHVPLAVLVDEVAALSARGFRDQDAGARKARRVELDHLHVLQRDACPIGECHPISRLDETVRRELVDATTAARREDVRLPLDRDHRPATQIHGDDAGARPAVDDEARDEVLVEPMDAVYFIDVWKSVWRMWKPTLSAAYTVRFTDMPPNARWLTRPSSSRDHGQP